MKKWGGGSCVRLTTEQMPAVGFNRQDSLLQADGTGHVCVELLPVLCLEDKVQSPKPLQPAAAVSKWLEIKRRHT